MKNDQIDLTVIDRMFSAVVAANESKKQKSYLILSFYDLF